MDREIYWRITQDQSSIKSLANRLGFKIFIHHASAFYTDNLNPVAVSIF